MADYAKALHVACAAADKSREIIQQGFRTQLAVDTKDDNSPVTEIDRAAELAIRSVLREAFPDYGIIGEEYGGDAAEAEYSWLVDPIDGTVSFVNGLPFAATLIALRHNQQPVVAVLDLPVLERRATAIAGQGAWEEGNRLSVRQDFDPATNVVSHGDYYTFGLAGRAELYQQLADRIKYFRAYTDAYGHYLVASGAVSFMVDPDLAPWDAAVPALIVREAGGRVEQIPDPNNPDMTTLIAGSPEGVAWAMEFL